MGIPARLAPLLLLLSACSESDDGMGPGPDPERPPEVESFLATDATLVHGEWTQLRWRVPRASVASIAPDVGPLSTPEGGAVSVRPHRPTTYVLTASNARGTVSDSVVVDVQYFAGVYVHSVKGDDANTGSSPQDPILTLGEALARTTGGGAIFLSAGVYDVAVVIDGPERSIFGGLNPDTFFEEGSAYETWVRPAGAGTPLTVRNSSAGISFFSFVKLDARNGGEAAARIEDSRAIFEDCVFEARLSGSGTALLARGGSDVTVRRGRIHGGRKGAFSPGHAETRGVAVLDDASLTLRSCFVDGGWASNRATGVDVATTGLVRLGFNTISAHLPGSVVAQTAAAIRLRAGNPALSGNILFTRGSAERHAIIEESADADPSWMLGNLFVSAGTPPYDNHAADGPDPLTQDDLNGQLVNGDVATVFLNRLVTAVSASELFVNWDLADYHLVSPLMSGGANPAVDAGDALLLNSDLFGEPGPDIDRQARPGIASQWDLGADEH